MPPDDLTQHLLALPLADRVALAEALWESIDARTGADLAPEERRAVEQAIRRDAELSSGAVAGRTHQQVMEAARRVVRCG